MAFSALPTNVIASWSEDGTNVTFPIASIPELTAAEADAATGDSRKIIYAMLERLYQWWLALAPADRPSRVTVSRSSSVDDATGNITRYYSIAVVVVPSGVEVIAE